MNIYKASIKMVSLIFEEIAKTSGKCTNAFLAGLLNESTYFQFGFSYLLIIVFIWFFFEFLLKLIKN